VIAALQEDTAQRVSFVVAVGGYYDMTDMLRYVTTGEDRHGAGESVPPPQRDARWAVLLSQLHWLDDKRDRAVLANIARRSLENPLAEQESELATVVARIGPQGQALYALVTNQDPRRVEALIEALPSSLVAELEALDLSARDLGRLEAQLVLINGPEDRVIPISHSRRLRDALPDRQVRLFEAEGLEHVALSPGWRDGWVLWRATFHLLALGERG
jgi:pimeloyl-ACP methyl ester carboxylesterase